MSNRKPWFKEISGWASESSLVSFVTHKKHPPDDVQVRITDARELTAEKAVEILCQREFDAMEHAGREDGPSGFAEECVSEMVKLVGMTARVVNGKVRVRKVKA